MVHLAGYKLCEVLREVLGITSAVTRIVVVADCQDVARVYVQSIMSTDQIESVAAAVEGLEVVEAEVVVDGDGGVVLKGR